MAKGIRWALLALAASLWVGVLAGCGGSRHLAAPPPDAATRAAPDGWETVTLVTFRDQWRMAKPRWADIGDYVYTRAYQRSVDSAAVGTITVAYDPTPGGHYFDAMVQASGLKPNFLYQLKLVGKPGNTTTGSGLWGVSADMAGNEAILRAGRWWNYQTEEAAFNTTNRLDVLNTTDYANGWVAGYIYMGYFVTNESGGTNGFVRLAGETDDPLTRHSYHVTWKASQGGTQSTQPIIYTIFRSPTSSGAYSGSPNPSSAAVPVWYEYEPGVPQPVGLEAAAGTYHAVLMVTEESFHCGLGGTLPSATGGYWLTVRVSGWSTGKSPKTRRPWLPQGVYGNDVAFAIP